MTLEERIEKLEEEINHLRSRVNDLDGRTIGRMMFGPDHFLPELDASFLAFSDKAIKDAKLT